jgi:hypothetical protein
MQKTRRNLMKINKLYALVLVMSASFNSGACAAAASSSETAASSSTAAAHHGHGAAAAAHHGGAAAHKPDVKHLFINKDGHVYDDRHPTKEVHGYAVDSDGTGIVDVNTGVIVKKDALV